MEGGGRKGSNWGLSKEDFAYHRKCHDLSGATVRHNERRVFFKEEVGEK